MSNFHRCKIGSTICKQQLCVFVWILIAKFSGEIKIGAMMLFYKKCPYKMRFSQVNLYNIVYKIHIFSLYVICVEIPLLIIFNIHIKHTFIRYQWLFRCISWVVNVDWKWQCFVYKMYFCGFTTRDTSISVQTS